MIRTTREKGGIKVDVIRDDTGQVVWGNLSHGTVSTGCQKSLRTRLASRSAMARKEEALVELKTETPARRLLRDPEVSRGRVLVMGGHRDGVLAFGETAEEAGGALLDLL